MERRAMTAEAGLFFLILALLVALFQAAFLLPRLQAVIGPCLPGAAWLQALAITLAFAALMVLRLDSDFSVVNVIQHSNLTLPTLYKIAGTWGNHEGSMLLWVWVLGMFGAVLSGQSKGQMSHVKNTATAVQSFICAGFLVFILLTSNPFARQFPPVTDGMALNPILQDIALAMHPPLLYLGYVGFSVVFSLGVAALLQGKMEREWAHMAHPWILAAWSALTLGIGLGSWWAYRVLGWGGFWFWDPVENVSLLPWLSGTALLHSNIVLKKRGMLAPWVLLLSIITFGLSMLGTFLVRSGVLISVHSFASDPMRGFFILGYITLLLGGALLLFALRAGKLQPQEKMLPLSREGVIIINNLFLLTACATVLLGTVYPIIMEWLAGDKITVGPPYYNATFLPLMAVPLVFAGLAPFMPWKKARAKEAIREARPALLAALAAALLVLAAVKTQLVLALLGFSLAAWLLAASVQWVRRCNAENSLPVFLGHAGAAILVAGITGAGLWQSEVQRTMRPGDEVSIAGYTLRYERDIRADTKDYHATRAEFRLGDGSLLAPEMRRYLVRNSGTSVPAIRSTLGGDLYAVIGEAAEGATPVRVYYNPLTGLMWGGCVLMALGGIVSIARRRHAE